jgi:integrase
LHPAIRRSAAFVDSFKNVSSDTGEIRMGKLPTYRRHPNGQAFIEHKAQRTYLGKYDSPESRKSFAQIVSQIAAGGPGAIAELTDEQDASIDELILPYLHHAIRYYSEDGEPTKEFKGVKAAMNMLSGFAGETEGRLFGPRMLVAFQNHLVGKKHARPYVNKQVARVKRFFRWCSEQERLPGEHWHKLNCVRGLEAGRTVAPEPEAIEPVPRPIVELTLPFLQPMIAAMVQVQMLCGMRPQDVCNMRGIDIAEHEPIWIYEVPKHKNKWRGHTLIKAIPRAAQAILKPYMPTDLGQHVFSPMAATAARLGRFVQRRKRKIRDRYDTDSYRRAINYGLAKAAREKVEIPHWHPNQLRHSIATEIRQSIGEQAAQIWLGHACLETTSIYTAKQTTELVAIAQELDRRWAK